MDASALAEVDAQYRLLREECGMLPRPDDGFVEVSGSEAAEYLQGQVTNDIEALEPGRGAYAALLERKARIQADMDVLCLEDGRFLVHTEPGALAPTLEHLEMYKIGRDVDVADRSSVLEVISLIGPGGATAVGIRPGDELSHEMAEIGGARCRTVARPIGELPAVNLIVGTEDAGAVRVALESAGVPEVTEDAVEVLRIEAGVPRFGRELTGERMPAEAGIVERAVSFTKGCYIGQEPVARLHYRGRPNRLLRFVELSEPRPAGSSLELDEKAVGVLTSSALSPANGPIGLAVLRREAEPGSQLQVAGTEAIATVRELPGTNGWGS